MKVREPKFKIGEKVCPNVDLYRSGKVVEKGTIGIVTAAPITIHGDFAGEYHVAFQGVYPGAFVIAEGLLYCPRKRKGECDE